MKKMTAESKAACDLVDTLLSQPTILEAISKTLDVPRNPQTHALMNEHLAGSSHANDCNHSVSRSNYNTRFRDSARNVEEEVRHIFSRGRNSSNQLECGSSQRSSTNMDQCSNTHQPNSMTQSPMFHFTRNFGRPNAQRMQKAKYNRRHFRGPPMFTKEIIILSGPYDETVVKQGTKQLLYESGHIITTFEFNKFWTNIEVQENLRRAFSPKIDTIDIQLLMPCHNKLVKPLLMDNQSLSGLLISKIFKQKSVYLLPSKQILDIPEKTMLDKLTPEKSELANCLESGPLLDNNSAASEYPHNEDISEVLHDGCTMTAPRSSHTVGENTLLTSAQNNISRDFHHHYQQYTELLSDSVHIHDEDDFDSNLNVVEENDVYDSDSNEVTLKDLLVNLALQIDCEKISKFNINRREIWDGARRGFLRKTYKPTNRISVMFTDSSGNSEGAVDFGGPTRTFLRLLMYHLQNSKLFEGPENKKTLSCDAQGLRNDEYYLAGEAMAISLVHGGPAPNFLSPILYRCLVSEQKNVHPVLADVTDPEMQEMLHEEGLKTLGVRAMEVHKQLFEGAFIWIEKEITTDTFNAMFDITFSAPGSNDRVEEEKTIGYWRDYLQDCEELACQAKLEDILCFVTGANTVPPLGFHPQPAIEFINKSDGAIEPSKFPEANTCGNILRLPLSATYEEFKTNMDFGILNSPGFGRA